MKRTSNTGLCLYRLKYSLPARRVLASAIALFWLGCGKSAPPKPPPPDVEVVQVEQKDVPIWKEWIGTLDGLVNAQIKPQVTGYLLRQTYTDGSFVKKGQLLFEIDPRTFEAALDRTKGQLANAEGQLATARANQVKTQLDVNRYTPLAKEQAISQQDLDNAIQANEAAKAQVQAAKAQVEAAKAEVATAQLNVGFTKVVSLIDGIAGIAQAQIGDLVGPTVCSPPYPRWIPSRSIPGERTGVSRLRQGKPGGSKTPGRKHGLSCNWFWPTALFTRKKGTSPSPTVRSM